MLKDMVILPETVTGMKLRFPRYKTHLVEHRRQRRLDREHESHRRHPEEARLQPDIQGKPGCALLAQLARLFVRVCVAIFPIIAVDPLKGVENGN